MSAPVTSCPPEIVEFLGNPPTEEQWRAISMPMEPYVLIAGAGSGKTSVMAARVIYLALEAVALLTAARQGWLAGKTRGWGWLWRHRHELRRRRRQVQASKRVPDRIWMGVLADTLDTPLMALPAGVLRPLNALMRGYWRVVRPLV